MNVMQPGNVWFASLWANELRRRLARKLNWARQAN